MAVRPWHQREFNLSSKELQVVGACNCVVLEASKIRGHTPRMCAVFRVGSIIVLLQRERSTFNGTLSNHSDHHHQVSLVRFTNIASSAAFREAQKLFTYSWPITYAANVKAGGASPFVVWETCVQHLNYIFRIKLC